MNKLKKRIVILLVVLITIIILLLAIISSINKKEKEEILAQTTQEIDNSEETTRRMKLLDDKVQYLNIKKCLTQYISGINTNNSSYYGRDENNNYIIIVDDETINTNIYNLLSESYKTKNNININNVRDYVYNIEELCFYIPVEIYVKYDSNNMKSYGIHGLIENIDYKPVMESYLILNIDETNQTFSVEQLNSLEEVKNVVVDNMTNISLNNNNTYTDLVGIIDELVIKEYINTYKNLTLAYPEYVYNNCLDNEYKEKRFGTIEKFKEYVEKNRDEIIQINVKEYAVVEEKDYVQYIAIDKKGKYYIFDINSIFDYKILLDNYTVDVPYFVEKYTKSNSIEKGGYNIQKCIEAINNKDYSYVYGKLYDTFKNNNYKTEESFIKEIKNNLFEKNIVDTFSVENEGNIYIYNLSIKDETDPEKQKSMKIIMQLKEGTDFVISFSF